MSPSTMAVGIVLAIMFAYAGATCRDGWMPHVGRCYLFSHDLETWSGAYDICRILGGFLAEVDTAAEDQFLVSQMRVLGSTYWIGLTDLSEEGTFEWMSSGTLLTSSSFSNWLPHQPDNSKLNDNCVHYMYTTGPYAWNDFECLIPQKYICEQDGEAGMAVVG